MSRKMFASLSIGLVMTLFVMGSQPLAASDTPNVPLGITETPVATETSTNAPTNTPVPTQTPTNTPMATQTPTPTRPLATSQPNMNLASGETPTPTSTSTGTPTATRVIVLPVAGGPAEQSDAPSRIPEIIALIVGALAALAIGSDPHANHTPRK